MFSNAVQRSPLSTDSSEDGKLTSGGLKVEECALFGISLDDSVPTYHVIMAAKKKARLLTLNNEMSHLITDLLGESPISSPASGQFYSFVVLLVPVYGSRFGS